MSYPVTPTLSVDGGQARLTPPPTTVADGLPGRVGGSRSTADGASTNSVIESAGYVCVNRPSAPTTWSGSRWIAPRFAAPYR
jgi:hypothetical protein